MVNNTRSINGLELIVFYTKHINHLHERGVGNVSMFGNKISNKMITTLAERRDMLKNAYTKERHYIIDDNLNKTLEGKIN